MQLGRAGCHAVARAVAAAAAARPRWRRAGLVDPAGLRALAEDLSRRLARLGLGAEALAGLTHHAPLA